MKKLILFALLATGLSMAGCVKEPTTTPGEGGSGTIGVSLTSTPEVGVVVTRATVPGLVAPAVNEFDLRIVRDGANPDTSPYWVDITHYDTTRKHQVGDYTAIALCGDVEVEGFEKPAFGVVQPFTVVHNVETSVALEAKLMNMAVSVAPKVYPAETKSRFEQYFSTWSVEVLRENEVQEIDVKIAEFAKDEARVLYLKPEAFKLKLNYTHQSNGKTGSRTIEVGENVKACTLYEVSLDVNDGHVGGKQIVITFDDTTEIIELGDIEVGEGE